MTQPGSLTPPKAKKIYSEHSIHGDKRIDYYDWLKEKENPEVIDYLKAENDYADKVTAVCAELQQTLYDEYFSHVKDDDNSVPYKNGEYLYFTREEKGKSYRKHYRKKDVPGSAYELILDENEIAKDLSYCMVEIHPSPDNKILCYLVDTKGDYTSTAYFRDMDDGSMYEDILFNAGQLVWSSDSRSVYYCVYRNGSFGKLAYRHDMSSPHESDILLIEVRDERYFLALHSSKSKRFIFIESGCMVNNECFYIDQYDPIKEMKLFSERIENVRNHLEHNGEKFYILTNQNAPGYKIMTTPADKISKENWTEFISEKKDVKIESIEMFRDFVVLVERYSALIRFKVIKLADNSSGYVDFPEPVYTALPAENLVFESSRFRYLYMSFITPRSIIEYDMENKNNFLLKENEIPNYDKTRFVSERLYAKSHDGKQIPVSLVYKKGVKKDGTNPALVHSYGSYGISSEIFFWLVHLPLLERGFVFAIAHVRGGGELGERWYEEGKLLNKKNTFYDFISCCEFLVKEGYTYQGGISAVGASAGGTLMGAVANMRPELFRCILAFVPAVDILSMLFDPKLENSVFHFDENGDPNIAEHYYYLKSYSPYENVKLQNYPNMLLTAGFNDVQVRYWEPAKFVAKLRENNTGRGVLLFKTRMDSAHFGSSGRQNQYMELAYNYAFMLNCYGIEKSE